MDKRSLFLFAALGLLVSLGGVGSANASSISQVFTHISAAVPYSFTFDANQFNPGTGTLNSVVITVQTDIVGTVNVINTNTTPETFTNATASVPVTLTGPVGPGTITLSATAITPPQSGTV